MLLLLAVCSRQSRRQRRRQRGPRVPAATTARGRHFRGGHGAEHGGQLASLRGEGQGINEA